MAVHATSSHSAPESPGKTRVTISLRQKTILQQILLYFAAVGGVLILAAWFSYDANRKALERQADAAALGEVVVSAQKLDLFMQKCAARVNSIASHQRATEHSTPRDMREFIVDLLARTPPTEAFDFFVAYDKMSHLDPDANLVVDRLSWPKTYGSTYDYHDPKQSWYNTPKTTGKAYLTEPYYDIGAVNQSMVTYSIPVYDRAGEFVLVAGVDVLLDGLSNLVRETQISGAPSNRQSVIVASKSGKLIAHPNSLLLPGKDRAGADLTAVPEGRFVGSTPKGVQDAVLSGEERRIYWAVAPVTGWKVVASVSEPALMASIDQVTNRVRNICILAFLAIVGVALVSAIQFTRPIRKLAQYATGDMTQSIETEREDELGQLGRSFKGMVDYQAQLDRANKDLESFAYSVSHDLRAPLRAIGGYANVLAEDYGAVLDEEGKRVCSAMCGSVEKMSHLIDDLLEFSRLSCAALAPAEVNMNELVTEIVEELCPRQERSNVTVELSPLPNACADSRLLKQVWMNLLSNAIKFSSKREKPLIRVSGKAVKGEIVYSVIDNGSGFDMQHADKLFVVFQRLHSASEFPGTGVGLAIVQRIVERHGGRVWAESKIGQGASFYFTLPASREGCK